MKRFRIQFIVGLFLTTLLLVGHVLADNESSLRKSYDETEARYTRVRGLALSILKQIKEIDSECRFTSGSVKPSKVTEARTRLGRTRLLWDAFQAAAEETEQLLAATPKKLDKAEGTSTAEEVAPKLDQISSGLKKYRDAVGQYYNKAIADFGEPMRDVPQVASMPSDQTIQVSGEVTAGLAGSQYKRPNADPVQDASSTDFDFGVNARWVPSERTNVIGRLSHESTVERREISLTNFGASVIQNFSPAFTGSAGLDLRKYADKENDLADYSDMGLFARVDLQKARSRFDAQVRTSSRGYGNFERADYSTTTLLSHAYLPLGQGMTKLKLKYLSKSTEDETIARSFNEFNPAITIEFSPRGTELGVEYQTFTHTEQDDSPLDNNRLRGHLHFVKRKATGTVRVGPEVNMYSYPNADDANFSDYKFIYRASNRGEKMSYNSWEAAYRAYENESLFDFAQLRWRRQTRPIGSGRYGQSALAVRYYTEASDDSDSLRFASVHPPHSIDFEYEFGWMSSGAGWLRRIKLGPVIGHTMYLDTERSDAFDEDLVDVDFVWRNPANAARIGLEAGFDMIGGNGVTARIDAGYTLSLLYNAEPSRSTSIFEIRGRLNYPVNDRWSVDGNLDMHQTRAEVESYADLDKYNIGVQVRYLFDVRR
ncbi:hypothetical protein GF377_11050 [candidate division GN15 bacterium]|nr:hypothetical protein [candidate division GN15 bacterium]